MRRRTVVVLVGFLTVSAPWAPAAAKATVANGSAAKRADQDGWPATREGAIARRWVQAFSAGDSAMIRFYASDLASESLVKKTSRERLEIYHRNRERFGKLVLASVVAAKPGELTASLMASDASLHEFVFAVQTRPPYKLVSVSMRDRVSHGGHGFFDHFHH